MYKGPSHEDMAGRGCWESSGKSSQMRGLRRVKDLKHEYAREFEELQGGQCAAKVE